MAASDTARPTAPATRKPYDDEIDVYAVTHAGHVRHDNQDHYLVCALRKQVVVQLTSLTDTDQLVDTERLAFLAMVADGVGGGAKGGEASRVALQAVTQYVARSMRCYYAAGSDEEFSQALQDAAYQCHAEILRRGEEDPDYRGMATTLTLYLGVWPREFAELAELGEQGRFDEVAARLMGHARPVQRGDV